MPSLQDQRFQEIAQYLQGVQSPAESYGKFTPNGSWVWNQSAVQKFAQQFGLSNDPNPLANQKLLNQLYGPVYQAGLKSAGFAITEAQGYGPEFSIDAAKLQRLVDQGAINPAEANAFLLEKYPQSGFSGGKFDIATKGALAEAQAEIDAMASSDPTVEATQTEIQLAIAQAGASASQNQPGLVGPLPTFIIKTPKLPDGYEARRVAEALRSVAEQASVGITQLAQGNIRYQPNSIDGASLIPGTVQPEKLHAVGIAKLQRDWPDDEDVVVVRTTPDFTLDRWIRDTGDFEGPGRVRRVTSVEYPARYKPRPGPQRFRVVMDGFLFGLAALRYRGATLGAVDASGVDAFYGAIIRGIPHLLGRPPQAIVAAFAAKGLVSSASATGTGVALAVGTTQLWHTRATEEFTTSPSLAYAPFGAGGAVVPTVAELERVEGIDLMLVTGRTQNEVYAQLNSRPTPFATIGGNNRGYPFSIPADRPVESPFTPDAVHVVASPGTGTVALNEGASGIPALAVTRRWLDGIPIDYDSCLRLRADSTSFSLWVSPSFPKILASTYPDVPPMSQWGESGVQVAVGEDRSYAVDVIIV